MCKSNYHTVVLISVSLMIYNVEYLTHLLAISVSSLV